MRLVAGMIIVTVPGVAFAGTDGVTALCLDAGGTEAICVCATEHLTREIGPDAETYGRIGQTYVDARANGQAMADAWDAAIQTEAARQGTGATTLLVRTNGFGDAHRTAIQACSG